MDEVISVENRDRVINLPALFHVEKFFKHPFKREALRLFRFVDALADDCAFLLGNFSDNKNIVEFIRVFERL